MARVVSRGRVVGGGRCSPCSGGMLPTGACRYVTRGGVEVCYPRGRVQRGALK